MSQFEEKIMNDAIDAVEKKVKPRGKQVEKIITEENCPILLSTIKAEDLKKEWIWEGYIAKGFFTLLTAPPKVGKSEFIRGFLKAVEDEKEFVGQPTTKINVLVISEEDKSDWVEKRDEFDITDKLNIWVWSKPFLTKIKLQVWEEFHQEVLDFCIENKIELVIMDTISKFWPVNDENDATQINDAMRPSYLWTRANLAVLVIHHDNKHGGNFGANIRGSSAIAGFADMLISYGRMEGANNADRKRVLKISGRFSNAEDNIVVEWQDDLTYKYIGDRYSVSKSGRIEVILNIFNSTCDSISMSHVKNQWDITRFGNPPSLRTIQRYINELIDRDILLVTCDKIISGKKTRFYARKGYYSEQKELPATKDSSRVSPLSQVNTGDVRQDSGDGYNVILSHVAGDFDKGWDPRI